MEVASIDGWYRNRKKVLDFYNIRRKQLENVQPNEAHKLIASLESRFKVDVITQNVDNLHERAGSTNVLHLHGELSKVRPENTYCDADGFSEKEVYDVGYGEVHLGDKAPNGVQLRPHIVFFGEAVPNMTKAVEIVSKADIVLIVGTSLSVYPAASLYHYAPDSAPVYLIDPKAPGVADSRLRHIQMVATAGMREFVKMV